jgi:hypothetical protein
MITRDELRNLYDSQLKQRLTGLESLRKTIVKRQLLAIMLILMPVVLYFVFIKAIERSGNSNVVFMLLIACAIGGLIVFFLLRKKKKTYRARYKNEVVREVVKAIDPDWNYDPDICISQNEYNTSDLFRKRVDRYDGDDFISGQIDKTDFRCSELHTQFKEVTYDKDGRQRVRWITIFKGLFFHADFNKHIKGKTYIEPDNAERLFGKFGQKFQASSKGDLVKLENIEFEKNFAVYSTDQIEARYILTPTIMEALVNVEKKYNRKMNLSFIDNRVYCAMSFKKNLFEPKFFSSGVKFRDIEFMYSLLMMNAIIVEELNLNTRIWTKE